MINPNTKELREIEVFVLNYETMINDAESNNPEFS